MVGLGEQLEALLRGLLERNPDIRSAVIISPEGLPLTSTLGDPEEEEELAASTGLTLTLAERASEISNGGQPKEVILRGENAYQLLFPFSRGGGIAVFANPEAKLGVLLYELRKMVERIETVGDAGGES